MSEFRRQPSKVWWSNLPDGDDSRIAKFPDWGKGLDLSGSIGREATSKNECHFLLISDTSKEDKGCNLSQLPSGTVSEGGGVDSEASPRRDLLGASENGAKRFDWEDEKSGASWHKSDRSNDRVCSSSPSQGSHKSQDSGFSDSEIHGNAPLLHSPRESPDLPKRRDCSKCAPAEKVEASSAAAKCEENAGGATNEALATEVTIERRYLETAFDGNESSGVKTRAGEESAKARVGNADSGEKTQIAREPGDEDERPATSNDVFAKTRKDRVKSSNCDKINKIQNQLELACKFSAAKAKSTRQNSNSRGLSHSSAICRQQIDVGHSFPGGNGTEKNVDASACDKPSRGRSSAGVFGQSLASKLADLPKGSGKGTLDKSESDLDSEGFKIPRTLAEQNINYKGSDNFLNLTHIEGPPISSSTPKSMKFRRQESPTPKAARATEKKVGSMSTFATVRKLKGLSDRKMRRPVSLFPSFNRSKNRGNSNRKGKSPGDTESSIRQWLAELGTIYEAEIMTTLQSKSLATDLTRQVTSMAATTSETVRKLHHKTRIISAEFSRVFQHKRNKNYKMIPPLVQSLIGHVKEFVADYVQNSELIPRSKGGDGDGSENQRQLNDKVQEGNEDGREPREMVTDFRLTEPETKEIAPRDSSKSGRENSHLARSRDVLEACEELRHAVDDNSVIQKLVEENLNVLGRKFTQLVDVILLTHVKALVRALEEPKTELALRTALSALTSLDLEGNVLSDLVARTEGVRALLAVCLEARATAVRVMALRALTIVCCVTETIAQFEQAGGLEIISEILAEDKRPESELGEAVAVLAQITAPWIKDNHALQSLSQFLGDLVKSLTRIINNCESSETLLLSVAALANLTFMEPRTVWPLIDNHSARTLLSAVRRQGPKVSVFIQEQAATVVANMASVPECRKHLAENRAVVALLCFLQIRHSPYQQAAEIAAAERVQQKSAIALSRLCSDSTVARQVVELQGVKRLVRLCKEERERNHSDGVLVACLAALRKIVANCGTEALEKLEAMELVEPRLLDSFLLYSSKQESYV